MARRLTLEGAEVVAVAEIMPYSSGLTRNIVQCLEDYDIPLYLGHTVVEIKGKDRITGVTLAKVDRNLQPIRGYEREIECDTLLLSVGLIPENELAEKASVEMDPETGGPKVNEFNETSVEGIYSVGNCLQVHDLVDWVTLEAENAGIHAARYLKGGVKAGRDRNTIPGEGIRQVVPQYYSGKNDLTISLRVDRPYEKKSILIKDGEKIVEKIFQPKMNPAEMIRIKLGMKEVENTKELRLHVGD
jgi:NADPH-dependent 2,4-dienoyl-CoA reductase/sulfur reductase-like enzyme